MKGNGQKKMKKNQYRIAHKYVKIWLKFLSIIQVKLPVIPTPYLVRDPRESGRLSRRF
jgi:hypothetical protein